MAFHPSLVVDSKKNNRSIDRRRETSRFAARDRRGKEADIFTDLKDVVPVVEESTVTHVDRIALLRVASTLCRMRKHAQPFFSKDLMLEDNPHVWNENTLSECLDGFVIIADSDGTMLYITESVSIFLGLTQTDLVGRAIKDFIHPNDYDELMRIATDAAVATEQRRPSEDDAKVLKFGQKMVMRMKTVISPRGRNLNLKSALYKAIVCRCRSIQFDTGKIMLIHASTTPAGQGNSICMTNASVKGSETTSGSFMTRHTCDMRFSYVSESFNYLLRHESRSLMGASFYDLVHPADLPLVAETMAELFRKGHCRSSYYRLIGANNSVAWVQTEATTVNHTTRGQKGQYILCVHSLVGMQSEMDSWTTAGSVCSDVPAAARPACQYIKSEIEDVAEYLGRQPQYIDCHDFTPLIDTDAGINMSEYRPMREIVTQPQVSRQILNNPPRRKDSYNEVLEWLFRDQPGSPPPNTTVIRGTYDNLAHQGFEQSRNGFRDQRSQQQYEFGNPQSRGHSLDGRRNNKMVRMGGSGRTIASQVPTQNQQHQQFNFDAGNYDSNSSSIDDLHQQFSRPRNCTITTTSMDDQNRFAHRATSTAGITRTGDAHHPSGAINGLVDGHGGREDAAGRSRAHSISIGLLCDPGYPDQQRYRSGCEHARPTIPSQFSPLTAGFSNFGVTSPEDSVSTFPNNNSRCAPRNQLSSQASAAFGNDNNNVFSNVSALPTSHSYTMSNAGQCGPQESIGEQNSNMHATMSGASHKRHFEEAQVNPTLNVDALPVVGAPQQISPEFFEEFKKQNPQLFPSNKEPSLIDDNMCHSFQSSSDSLEYLAPFVAEEDMLQLNSDPFPIMDVNFPELDLSGYAFESSFGKQIQPNPFCEKQLQLMRNGEDGLNPPLKRARITVDDSYQANSY